VNTGVPYIRQRVITTTVSTISHRRQPSKTVQIAVVDWSR